MTKPNSSLVFETLLNNGTWSEDPRT